MPNTIETIKCSDCHKKLLNYVKYADSNRINMIKAICPFCNSKSFTISVQGMIQLGPIGKNESNYPTIIDNIETNVSNNTYSSTIFLKRG